MPIHDRRVDGDLLTVDRRVPAPRAELGEPLRVEGDPVARPQDVALLLHDVEEPVPGEIDCDALGFVHHDAAAGAAGPATSMR